MEMFRRNLRRITIGFGPTSHILLQTSFGQHCKFNLSGDKSFADDLNMERGNVSGREALLPRGAEFHPLFFDLFRYVLKRH
jgi:hypothetical protein